MRYPILLLLIIIISGCQDKNEDPYKQVKWVVKSQALPKDHPAWAELKGRVFISKTYYDEAGRKSVEVCKQCETASHGPSYNVVTNYYYTGGLLVRTHTIKHDTTDTYYYYKDKDLVRTYEEGRDTIDSRIKYFKAEKVKFEYSMNKDKYEDMDYVELNEDGKEVRRISLNLGGVLTNYSAYLSISENHYDGDEKRCVRYWGEVVFYREDIAMMLKSNPKELKAIFERYCTRFMNSKGDKKPDETISVRKEKKGKLIMEAEYSNFEGRNRVDSTQYFYNSRGLPIKEKEYSNDEPTVFEFEYQYGYR